MYDGCWSSDPLDLFLRHSRATKIYEIKSKKVRNLLRGLDFSSYKETKNSLDKIKKIGSKNDHKNAFLYIKSCGTEGDSIGNLLNSTFPRVIRESIELPLEDIITLINKYEEELLDISSIATDLLLVLRENKLDEAISLCEKLADSKGASVFLLRMLAFIHNRSFILDLDKNEVLKKLEAVKKRVFVSNVVVIDDAINQLSNLRTSHLAICKRINDIPSDSVSRIIIKSFINPICRGTSEFKAILSSLFSISLFDAFLYLKLSEKVNVELGNKVHLSKELCGAYERFSGVSFEPNYMYEAIDADAAHYYLRECFLFIEQKRALNFVSVHGHYYSDFASQKPPTSYAERKIHKYFSHLNNLAQLRCKPANTTSISWDRYEADSSGILENSSALIYLMNKKQGNFLKDEQSIFIKLMTYTSSIGETCSPEYLKCLYQNAQTKEVQLVANCLRTINGKSNLLEHQLRRTIQEYCKEEFESDLIKLLCHLYSYSTAVTEHLISILDEKFLSTLFHMIDKPVDALKSRADMLQWYGEHTDQEIYKDRAKTLRIDIQIHREKGTIDDSRIYVDPLKFTQWFEDNMSNKLTSLLDNLSVDQSQSTLNWSRSSKGVSTIDIVIKMLLDCYSEFCENNSFGIASYLGRRIRHGTFEGTATSELRKLADRDDYQHLFSCNDFKKEFDKWHFEYDRMIESLQKSVLHIKSRKKPKGTITTDIDSLLKKSVANQMFIEVLSSYSQHKGVVLLPSLVLEFCWRLVEFDLVETKKLLSQKKSEYGVFKYRSISRRASPRTKEMTGFITEVNSLTGQKFGLMSSWFNKPNYASPSADIYLLFNAVISEVKDSVIGFSPNIMDSSERSFTVNGGTYYVIYDALYVLIHNAATHGKLEGKISLNVSKPEQRDAIKISLETELESKKLLKTAVARIEDAMAHADENANVIEGNSGMKKLKRLEHEGSISDIKFLPREENNMLVFEFFFELSNRGKYDDFNC